MGKKESLMSFRPKNDAEKLLWERQANKILIEEKRNAEIKCGEIQSELDEFKDEMKKSRLGALILKSSQLERRCAEYKGILKKLKKENQELIGIIARYNLSEKLKNESQVLQEDPH